MIEEKCYYDLGDGDDGIMPVRFIMYAYCADYHGGQWSREYRFLRHGRLTDRDYDRARATQYYQDMVSKYQNQEAQK